jgi:uncharacterized DUF497 family protein
LADAPHIRFAWDDAKNDRCVRDRGFGFADILPAFLDPNRRVERDVRLLIPGEVAHESGMMSPPNPI